VNCDRFREAASARLDGEPLGLPASALDGHLATCPDCARWSEEAAQVTRLARLDVRPVPDLSDLIATEIALPARRVARRRRRLRVALLLAGIAQFLVGLPALTGDSIGMAMAAHATHEAAAWNLAIGAAFVAAALVPRRAAGLIPLLGTFIVVLGALSVHDLATGAVTVGRLATHAAALVGLLLLVLLDRAERALPPGSWRRESVPGNGSSDADDGTNLRTVA
jgi:predicted anti-sigma-YlaC factor YlaD